MLWNLMERDSYGRFYNSSSSSAVRSPVQEDIRLILDLVTVLAVASVGGYIASWSRQPVLLGYLLAGILVGPTGLGWIKEVVQVETLAQFGVTFLLFTLGVEFSLAQLNKVRGIALSGGGLQILLTILATTLLTGIMGWFTTPAQGVFLGAILSLSSTAVVMKSLTEANQTDTPHGRAMLGILIVQDLAVGLMLAVLPALDHPLTEIGWAMGKALLEIGLFGAGALVVGIYVLPVMLRLLAERESKELFLLGVISLCSGIALLTQRLGISSEIGAFVAGLMISEVEYADQTLDYVEPVRDVFAALFFAAIGMLIDPSFIWAHLPLIAVLVSLVVVGKFAIITPLTLIFKYPLRSALLVGLGLAQIGEFSFVLASEGQALHLVSRQTYLLIVSTTAATLLVTPLLLQIAPSLFRLLEQLPLLSGWLQRSDQPLQISPQTPAQAHVVLCGYGRVGQDIIRLLDYRQHPLLVIDQRERVIQQLRQQQIPYLYGDAASPLVLQKANITQARAMVIVLPDLMSIRLCLKRALQLAPDLDIVVRAPSKESVEQLYQLGAREVVHPEFEASLEICSHVLVGLGESLSQIQREMLAIRASHYEDLRSPYPTCLRRPVLPDLDSIQQLELELGPAQSSSPPTDPDPDQQEKTELKREVEAWYAS